PPPPLFPYPTLFRSRGRRLHRLRHSAGGTRHRWEGRNAGGRYHADTRCAGREAHAFARAAGNHRQLEAAAEEKLMAGKTRTKTDSPIADGLPTPRRYWAVAVMILGITITVFDSTMSNVALPAISASLGIPASQSVWVVLAYSLTVVGCMLPLSAVAERVGFRPMYAAGVTLFLVGSVSAALSSSMTQLVASRVGQGLGSAML